MATKSETLLAQIRAAVEKQMTSTLDDLPGWIDDTLKTQAANLAAQILGARWDTWDKRLVWDTSRSTPVGKEIRARAEEQARVLLADALPKIELTDADKRKIAKAYRDAYVEELKQSASGHGIRQAREQVDDRIEQAIKSVLNEPVPEKAPDEIDAIVDLMNLDLDDKES